MMLYTVNAVPTARLSEGKYMILPINSPKRFGVTNEKDNPAKIIFKEVTHLTGKAVAFNIIFHFNASRPH